MKKQSGGRSGDSMLCGMQYYVKNNIQNIKNVMNDNITFECHGYRIDAGENKKMSEITLGIISGNILEAIRNLDTGKKHETMYKPDSLLSTITHIKRKLQKNRIQVLSDTQQSKRDLNKIVRKYNLKNIKQFTDDTIELKNIYTTYGSTTSVGSPSSTTKPKRITIGLATTMLHRILAELKKNTNKTQVVLFADTFSPFGGKMSQLGLHHKLIKYYMSIGMEPMFIRYQGRISAIMIGSIDEMLKSPKLKKDTVIELINPN